MDKVEFLILSNLLYNEEYVRKVLPFIKGEYFEDYNQKVELSYNKDYVARQLLGEQYLLKNYEQIDIHHLPYLYKQYDSDKTKETTVRLIILEDD